MNTGTWYEAASVSCTDSVETQLIILKWVKEFELSLSLWKSCAPADCSGRLCDCDKTLPLRSLYWADVCLEGSLAQTYHPVGCCSDHNGQMATSHLSYPGLSGERTL